MRVRAFVGVALFAVLGRDGLAADSANELRRLGVAPKVDGATVESAEVASALREAGFTVVSNSDADVIIRVQQSSGSQSGGVVEYELKVTALSTWDSAVIDESTRTFSSMFNYAYTSREVPPRDLKKAIQKLASSDRLLAYVGRLDEIARAKAEHAEEERRAEERRVAEESARRARLDTEAWERSGHARCAAELGASACDGVKAYAAERPKGLHVEEARLALESAALIVEEEAWRSGRPATCRKPVDVSSCDGVRAYLVRYPTGRYANEAQECLTEAQPRILVLADELAWKTAAPGVCSKPTASTDCDGLVAYVSKYPSGARIVEARKVLKSVSTKLISLKKAEEARAEATEAIGQLCQVLLSLDQLNEAEGMQRRVDARSGTVDPGQRRQFATARIYMGDQRQTLTRQIASVGVRFDRRRDCESH